MKKLFLLALLAAFCSGGSVSAKDNSKEPWMDPNVTRVNTLAPHASFFAFETEDLSVATYKSLEIYRKTCCETEDLRTVWKKLILIFLRLAAEESL